MNKKVILSLIFVFAASSGFAQTVLSGKILDERNAPIAYATVSISTIMGTASDERGEFHVQIEPENQQATLLVSCIGYHSKRLSIDSLIDLKKESLDIHLKPFITTLQEVTIHERNLTAVELVEQAINAIPSNYRQSPFNMEFYSKVSVFDSVKTSYVQETIVKSYREGYVSGAENRSRIEEMRVTGNNPLPVKDKKRNIDYFGYELLPTFDVFLVDFIGAGTTYNYTVFNPQYFKRLEFRQVGISNFEHDTVIVIQYDQKSFKKEEGSLGGTLFISTRNLAIVKHERRIGKNYLEVIYKDYNGNYFPYFVKTIYPEKKEGKVFKLNIVHEAYITKVETDNIEVIPEKAWPPNSSWHLVDVPYNKAFWDKNYPKR